MEEFDASAQGVPAKSAMGLMRGRAVPANNSESLRKRGLEMVARAGAPTTFSEIVVDDAELVEREAEDLL